MAKLVDGFIAQAAALPPADAYYEIIKNRIKQQPRLARMRATVK